MADRAPARRPTCSRPEAGVGASSSRPTTSARAGFVDAASIRDLDRRGHVVGSHSCSHPLRIGHCSAAQLRDEWNRSRDVISAIVGRRHHGRVRPGRRLSPHRRGSGSRRRVQRSVHFRTHDRKPTRVRADAARAVHHPILDAGADRCGARRGRFPPARARSPRLERQETREAVGRRTLSADSPAAPRGRPASALGRRSRLTARAASRSYRPSRASSAAAAE